MDEQNKTAESSGGEPEVPPRWALERAELQSDIDALVHKALAGLLESAENLKQRIREETLAEVQQSRRQHEAVLREIEEARQELEQVRGGDRVAVMAELEQERATILAEARAEADRIVQAARAERELLLEQIRASQNKLREFQEQLESLLGLDGGMAASTASPRSAESDQPAPHAEAPASSPSVPTSPTVSTPEPLPPAETPIAHEVAPPTNFSGLIGATPETPVVESPPSPAVPDEPAGRAGSRTMQLIFTNVPGYQQAAAIERTTRQLADVSSVDVHEFERGRLVLEVRAGNPSALADAMLSSAPAEMSVVDHSSNGITFRLS